MYPFSCHEDARFCNDIATMNEKLIRYNHNRSMTECCRAGRRVRDFGAVRANCTVTKCKCSLMAQQLHQQQHAQDQILAAAARIKPKYMCPNSAKSKTLKPSASCTSSRSIDAPTSSHARKATKRPCREREQKINPKRSDMYPVCVTETPNGPKSFAAGSKSKPISPKQLKNKRNFQFQDPDCGRTRHMEVINEELENELEDENNMFFENGEEKKAKESCADFLSIMHDTVLDTVQKSVEGILKDYFHHTMEKIERLCGHVVRNDTLMSQMYLDIMTKIADQNERNQCQFNTLCNCLLEAKSFTDHEKSCRESDMNSSCKHTCCQCSCSFESTKCQGSQASESFNSLSSNREHSNSKKRSRMSSVERGDLECSSQNSSLAEQLVNSRGGRDHSAAEQLGNNPGKNFNAPETFNGYRNSNLYEQLTNIRSIDPIIADKLINNPALDLKATEHCAKTATLKADEISKSHESMNAILVEKLSNSRDAINSILAEKLKSGQSSIEDEQKAYEAKKTGYSEELRKIHNFITQRVKGMDRKSSPLAKIVPRQTSMSALIDRKRPSVEHRSASQSDVRLGSSTKESSRKTFSSVKSGPSVSGLMA